MRKFRGLTLQTCKCGCPMMYYYSPDDQQSGFTQAACPAHVAERHNAWHEVDKTQTNGAWSGEAHTLFLEHECKLEQEHTTFFDIAIPMHLICSHEWSDNDYCIHCGADGRS